ncbi:aldose 1-epimerase family protein [Lichenicola sp.]|uniref:aldose 1-epimerase family protein n=1 Tax=Lichenicola sp. TaxID=2804529 RepID=UPI003B005CC5
MTNPASNDVHMFGSERLQVSVARAGAEPVSLQTAGGRELLWQAGPEWPRHAPVLFPIIGRLANDTLLHDGRRTRMTQHGFARDRRFEWIERDASGCRLALMDDAESRAIYPFAFRLEVAYRVEGDRLSVEYRIVNPGDTVLPASLGAHPAFRWPLSEDTAREAYRLVFADPEPAPIRRVVGGLLREAPEPSPIDGRELKLADALFVDDAVILDRPVSHAVTYEAGADGPALRIAWHGMTQLGIWSKPGAGFLCIEPWHGLASPVGFEGEFQDKPFLMHIPPGGEDRLGWSVQLLRS